MKNESFFSKNRFFRGDTFIVLNVVMIIIICSGQAGSIEEQ